MTVSGGLQLLADRTNELVESSFNTDDGIGRATTHAFAIRRRLAMSFNTDDGIGRATTFRCVALYMGKYGFQYR